MIERNDPMMPDSVASQMPIEIEIENPEDVTLRAGDVEVDLMPTVEEIPYDHNQNLAEVLDESELQTIANDLIEMFQADKTSRKEWVDTYIEGLDTLGLQIEERTEPWDGACGLVHPVVIEAAVRFQSETIMETFPASGPVRSKIIGKETPEKKDSAKRVEEDMNYRLTELIPEYRTEHEKLLFNLGLAGSAFKKVYFDPSLNREAAMFIPAEDLILPYGTSNIRTAHRITHVMRKTANEIKKLMASGFYRELELQEPTLYMDELQEKKAEKQGATAIDDERYTLLEIHCELNIEYLLDAQGEPEDNEITDVVDLEDESETEKPEYEPDDNDDIALPYVVTIDMSSSKVLSIRRNWLEEDTLRLARTHFVAYHYVTGFGAYGFGLIHLVGALAKGATSILRQLVDSGTLANLPGGLKARGLRIKGDDTPIAPGEYRDVDVPSGSIRDNIMPLPYKEPSQVLLSLFGGIVDEARRMAATADLKISDMSANAPVGTTLALLERQLKVMSAVQSRVHNSMKEEFKLLKSIIRDNLASGYEYTPDSGEPMVMQADYDAVDIIPVSDPNAATLSQRIAQLQAVQQMSMGAPQVYDLAQLHREALDMIGFPNAAKIVPLPDDKTRTPKDPVRENMAALIGEPMKVFSYQDHQAHIAAHQAFMRDPAMQQVLQSPTGQMVAPALMAHIQEHMAFEYRKQIEAMIGQAMPEGDQVVPPEMEVMLSQMQAQAGQALLQRNMQAQQAQQAQQMAQDPVLQQQDRELKIKEMETQRKAMNDQFDREVALERVALERERFQREDQRANVKEDRENMKAVADLRQRAADSNIKAQEASVKMAQAIKPNSGGTNE